MRHDHRLVNIAPLEAEYERYLDDLDKQFNSLPQDSNEYRNLLAKYIAHSKCLKAMNNLQEVAIDGSTSDGFHTFDELYHRTVLLSVIVSVYPKLCWKSRKNSDGTMFNNMFIVGINTPEGPVTNHCCNDLWDLFKCKIIQKAPVCDDHTSHQDIQRIASMQKPDFATVLTYHEALEQTKHEGAVWFESPETEKPFYARVYESVSSRGKVVVRAYDSTVFSVNKNNYKKTWVCFDGKPMYDESYNFWRSER